MALREVSLILNEPFEGTGFRSKQRATLYKLFKAYSAGDWSGSEKTKLESVAGGVGGPGEAALAVKIKALSSSLKHWQENLDAANHHRDDFSINASACACCDEYYGDIKNIVAHSLGAGTAKDYTDNCIGCPLKTDIGDNPSSWCCGGLWMEVSARRVISGDENQKAAYSRLAGACVGMCNYIEHELIKALSSCVGVGDVFRDKGRRVFIVLGAAGDTGLWCVRFNDGSEGKFTIDLDVDERVFPGSLLLKEMGGIACEMNGDIVEFNSAFGLRGIGLVSAIGLTNGLTNREKRKDIIHVVYWDKERDGFVGTCLKPEEITRIYSGLRGPGAFNLDAELRKEFKEQFGVRDED